MARNGLRIRPFEAHSHFQSIANPPRPQIPPENSKNQHFPKNQKIRKSGNPPGSAAMGGAPLILADFGRFGSGTLGKCSEYRNTSQVLRVPLIYAKGTPRAQEHMGMGGKPYLARDPEVGPILGIVGWILVSGRCPNR